MKRLLIALTTVFVAGLVSPAAGVALPEVTNTVPPASPVKLVFIHHSTGENWLADANGGLGVTLRDNNYFVSDTNYGWGPAYRTATIGDYTDIGHWWAWFRGPEVTTYTAALYTEYQQNSSYSRLATEPGGQNEIVMFKSCFPNSALGGVPTDTVPAIDDNPLRGEDYGNPDTHTVANAKGIYIDLLSYFATRPDKLFIVIAAPPLSDATYSSNARAFNNWLVNDWLTGYSQNNVYVFDFYNVLTTNGGSAAVNDLRSTGGNHHRFVGGVVQYKTDGDNDASPNVLEYRSGDDHPSRAGNLKAAAEFVPLLNAAYNRWKGNTGADTTGPLTSAVRRTVYRGKNAILYHRADDTQSVNALVTVRVKTRSGRTVKAFPWILRRTNRQLYVWFRVWLARGWYRVYVYATDQAGNPQSRLGVNWLVVR